MQQNNYTRKSLQNDLQNFFENNKQLRIISKIGNLNYNIDNISTNNGYSSRSYFFMKIPTSFNFRKLHIRIVNCEVATKDDCAFFKDVLFLISIL